jgi:RNA polymerase sigma factor (sigma-70 family)
MDRKNDNINDILTAYIERIYGYSIKNTFSRDEADELSQEILFTVIKQFATLSDKEKFEPWMWGIAGNVTKVFKRKQGRQRAMYSYDSHESLEKLLLHTDEYSFINEEIYGQMRTKIAQLSKIYRDIIVLHYYDNLSCRQIAEKLNIPEGTVTWRLSEGRRKLKEEYINMNTTVSALKPVSLNIGIHGNGNYNGKDRPFPGTLIDDALSQNILYNCYYEAKTVEDLSKLCGVPAFYIEDAANRLIKREALTEPVKGKYQTDFLIYGDEQAEYAEKASGIIDEIVDEFCGTLKEFTEAILKLNIYTAEKPVNELHYLFGILIMEYLNGKYNPLKSVPYKVKYDGNEWKYMGHIEGAKKNPGMGIQKSLNLGSEGGCAHYVYNFAGFAHRPMMYDVQINVCEKIFFKQDLSEKEKELSANLIKDGQLKRRSDDEIAVDIPFFTIEQKKEFDVLADKYFANIAPKIADVVKRYTDGYIKLFPKHLKEDAEQAMYFFFIGGFYANMVMIAQDKNLLDKPSPNNCCDVIVQFK